MSKKAIGHAAAWGSSGKSYGEKKIAGYTDDGESVSVKIQRTDVKKALCSVRKINLRGNPAGLDDGRSYMQNKQTGQKTGINLLRGGAAHHALAADALAVAVAGGGSEWRNRESFERAVASRSWPWRSRVFSPGGCERRKSARTRRTS